MAIAAYLGEGDAFSRSVADFAQRYADQNERDYQEFAASIRSGRLTAVEGVLAPARPVPPPSRPPHAQGAAKTPVLEAWSYR